MVLIGIINLIDNITNTAPGKPDCAIMAFTRNVKIIGCSFFFVKSYGVSLICHFLYIYQPVVFKGL